MRSFRYVAGKTIIHAGLRVLPPGRVRQELTQMLWIWRMKVEADIASRPPASGSVHQDWGKP